MSGKPFWVSEQEKALMEVSYRSQIDSLRHRIKQLEEENSDLKKKIAERDNVLLIAMGLLLKPQFTRTLSTDFLQDGKST